MLPGNGMSETQRGLDTPQRVPKLEPKVDAPYRLSADAKVLLQRCCEVVGCKRCNGSGVSGWKRSGMHAIVCRCALAQWKLQTGQTQFVPAPLPAPKPPPVVQPDYVLRNGVLVKAEPEPVIFFPTAIVQQPFVTVLVPPCQRWPPESSHVWVERTITIPASYPNQMARTLDESYCAMCGCRRAL